MGRLIEETKVLEVMKTHWLSGTVAYHVIDEIRTDIIKYVPTVEAIPKADYENRLKADLKAILVELQLEIEEDYWKDAQGQIVKHDGWNDALTHDVKIIQQKINSLKEG